MPQEWVEGMKLNLPQVLKVWKDKNLCPGLLWIKALDQSRSHWGELKWSGPKGLLIADVGLQISQKSKF